LQFANTFGDFVSYSAAALHFFIKLIKTKSINVKKIVLARMMNRKNI